MENLSCSKCVCNETGLQLKPKKISKNLWKLAYPTMISAGLQNFYDIVDMVWVGQISKTALSGVTLFSSIYMLFACSNIGLPFGYFFKTDFMVFSSGSRSFKFRFRVWMA